MIRAALTTLLASAAYGYALGAAHSELYATRNLLKFPVLIVVTACVCSLSWWLVALACGAGLNFAGVQRAAWKLFRDASVLLASLAPVVFFVARVLRATDDGKLGQYDAFLACNVAAVALAGTLALVRQARELLRDGGVTTRRSSTLVALWLVLTLGVGGQAAFFMRPFFGFPATRGNTPPWFLGAQPDVRGATSFYAMVAQSFSKPQLPAQWPREKR